MANDRFRAKFAKRIKKSNGKLEEFVEKLLLKIDYSLSYRSPVDKGTFKRNWVVGDGLINYTTTDDVSRASKGSYDNKNESIIKSLVINGQTIYITNSLPYAKELERGHSKIQAPFGVVGVTLAEINSVANKIGVQLRSV